MLELDSPPAVRLFPTERQKLHQYFKDTLETTSNLNRQVVSFQSNKSAPIYRWVKYKEGFSADLVKHFLATYFTGPGKVLDPFSGAGTTLFAAQELGWESYGIELLPVGAFITKAREAITKIHPNEFKQFVNRFAKSFGNFTGYEDRFKHISITEHAFSRETSHQLNRFLTYCSTIESDVVRTALQLAGFAILEEISFTRKDGQYLRWDHRSERNLSGKLFDKGKVFTFDEAISNKLNQIADDLLDLDAPDLFQQRTQDIGEQHPINIVEASCLKELPNFPDGYFDFVITSPPYCNRYDYTRTYALELVYLGLDSEQLRNLRQEMLSCTVENRDKVEVLRQRCDTFDRAGVFDRVLRVYDSCGAMNEVNTVLDALNQAGRLNNNNIPRMVRNYFLELCFVIFELARVTKRGGYCVMVNDNVRYGGEEIPVDLILSDFAEKFGFEIEKIFVLPRGKGNSSQQMGAYGRSEIRKCVYLWHRL